MNTKDKISTKAKALNLLFKGETKTEVCRIVGISRSTLYEWQKQAKDKDFLIENINLLNTRLFALLQTPTAKSLDIKNLTNALDKLNAILNHHPK